MGTLNDVNLKDKVMEFCGRLGWKKFMEMTPSIFRDLTLEFYTTLKLSDYTHKKFECRLNGQLITIDYDIIHVMFGFPKGGVCEAPSRYNSREF